MNAPDKTALAKKDIQRYRITINEWSEVKMGKDSAAGAYVKYIEHRAMTNGLIDTIKQFLSEYDSDSDLVQLEPLRAALIAVGAA